MTKIPYQEFGEKVDSFSKIKYMEDDNAISPETYERLSSADWETLGKKMLARAIWRGSARYQITRTTIFAGGYSIEDVVSHIIQSAFEGRRKWDPSENTLEDWLLSQVDSVIDWWLKLKENKNLAYEELDNTEHEDDYEANVIRHAELATVLRYGLPNPETIIIKNIEEDGAKFLYNALFDDTSNDPELQEVILVMMDIDDPKPSGVAEKLGISAADIYNRKKRLRRRLDKVMSALGKSLP